MKTDLRIVWLSPSQEKEQVEGLNLTEI